MAVGREGHSGEVGVQTNVQDGSKADTRREAAAAVLSQSTEVPLPPPHLTHLSHPGLEGGLWLSQSGVLSVSIVPSTCAD